MLDLERSADKPANWSACRPVRPPARGESLQGLDALRSGPVAGSLQAGSEPPEGITQAGRRAAAAGRTIPPHRRLRPGHGAGAPPCEPQARIRARSRRRRHGADRARAVAEPQDLVCRGNPRLAAGQCGSRPGGRRPRPQRLDECAATRASAPPRRADALAGRPARGTGAKDRLEQPSEREQRERPCTSSWGSRSPRFPPPRQSARRRQSRPSSLPGGQHHP